MVSFAFRLSPSCGYSQSRIVLIFDFCFLLTVQDHNGRIGGAELDALIRDLYIKNNKVKIPLPFKY